MFIFIPEYRREMGRVRMEFNNHKLGFVKFLLDVCYESGRWWCCYTTFWNKGSFRMVSVSNGSRIFVHSNGCFDTLESADFCSVSAGFRIRTHLACNVLNRCPVVSSKRTISFYEQLSRIQFWNWPNIPALWVHHPRLRLAACFLHHWHNRSALVHHVVLFGLQHSSEPPAYFATRARVYRAQCVE